MWNFLIGTVLVVLCRVQCNQLPTLKPLITQDDVLLATKPLLDDHIYVDKTRFVLQLLRDNQKRYIFVRPRRFGKTVFLRTLQSVFRGRKEVWKGTHIYNDSRYQWEKFPVMYFDLNADSLTTALNEGLECFKEEVAMKTIPKKCVFIPDATSENTPLVVRQFHEILCAAKERDPQKRSTVVLIDGYDHHIVQSANNPSASNFTTNVLTRLFAQMKRSAHLIKIAFATGITRCSFSMVGWPGGDFKDVSTNPNYGELAGITKDELKSHFHDHIRQLARRRRVPPETIENELKEWYEGYSFSMDLESLYNPMSVQRYLEDGVAKVYWGDVGRPPQFVWDQMLRRPAAFNASVRSGVRSSLSMDDDLNSVAPSTLLYDVGYFTIARTEPGRNPYVLDFPNNEARYAFFDDLAKAEKMVACDFAPSHIQKMKEAIEKPIPDFDAFTVASIAAIRRYAVKFADEESFHALLFSYMEQCSFQHLGMKVKIRGAEVDIVAETANTFLILELKFERPASEGMNHANRSVQHFMNRGKNTLAATINFNQLNPQSSIAFNHQNFADTVVSGWMGELRSPNGTLLKTYSYANSHWFKNWVRPTKKKKVTNTNTRNDTKPERE